MTSSPTQTERSTAAAAAAVRGFSAHLTFFDRDGDQKISLGETHRGLRRIGLGRLIALPGTALIHVGIAGLGLVRGDLQNPLQLTIPSVGVLRHPDTALVDAQADFEPTRLDSAFEEHGRRYRGDALTFSEILRMASARLWTQTHGLTELLLLPGGAAGTFIEWAALFWLAGERRDGALVLSKQAARRFYLDPEFLQDVASGLESARKQRAHSARGSLRNLVQSWLL